MTDVTVSVPQFIINKINNDRKLNQSYMNNEFEDRSELVLYWFLSNINSQYIIKKLYPGKKILPSLESAIKRKMENWVTRDADFVVQNVVASLSQLNKDFMSGYLQQLEEPIQKYIQDKKEYNDYVKSYAIGDHDHFNGLYNPYKATNTTSYSDLNKDETLPHMEYHNKDVYNNSITMREGHFRHNNRIPFYQYTMNYRPYDRDNTEGLRMYGERPNHIKSFRMDHLDTRALDRMFGVDRTRYPKIPDSEVDSTQFYIDKMYEGRESIMKRQEVGDLDFTDKPFYYN